MHFLLIGIISVFLTCIAVASCNKKVCEDDQLQLKQTVNSTEQLKLNGYYYGDTTEDEDPRAIVYYLFDNGVFMYATYQDLDLVRSENFIFQSDGSHRSIKRFWGLYRIQGTIIELERWSAGLCGLNTLYEKGDVLNDTTFIVGTRKTRHDGKVEQKDSPHSYFYFRQAAKPDSSNNFLQ